MKILGEQLYDGPCRGREGRGERDRRTREDCHYKEEKHFFVILSVFIP